MYLRHDTTSDLVCALHTYSRSNNATSNTDWPTLSVLLPNFVAYAALYLLQTTSFGINFPLSRYKLATVIASLSWRDYTPRHFFSYLPVIRLSLFRFLVSYLFSSTSYSSFFSFLLLFSSIFYHLVYIVQYRVCWNWTNLLGKLIEHCFTSV